MDVIKRQLDRETYDFLRRNGGLKQPSPDAPSEDYQRGWDDCLERVYKVLGENFPRRVTETKSA